MFSSLDTCGAYHAVRIEPESQGCTVLISPFGTFQDTPMPFGLVNAGSCLQQDAGCIHEGRRQRVLDVIAGGNPDVRGQPWAHFGTPDTGGFSPLCCWDQDTTVQTFGEKYPGRILVWYFDPRIVYLELVTS